MTHTGEKNYVCPYCQHGFIQNGPFKKHVLSVHGVEIPKGHHNSRLFIQTVLAKNGDNVEDATTTVRKRPRGGVTKKEKQSGLFK